MQEKRMKHTLVILSLIVVLAVFSGCESTEVQETTAREPVAEVKTPAPVTEQSTSGEIIIDDEDDEFSTEGYWNSATTSDEYNDATKWINYSPDGDAKAIFTPKIVKAGQYKVFEWHGADPQGDHATDAPYTINYAGGSKTIKINLDENIGQWNLLGTFRFKAGTGGNVTISNNANGNVVADAIKFVYAGE
jgi:hypothetical protein